MLDELLPPFFKLGVVGAKVSKNFYENLSTKLLVKNGTIKLLDSDPVIDYKKDSISNIKYDVFHLDVDISGIVSDDKFAKIKNYAGDNFIILVTSLEDIAYLTNCRISLLNHLAILKITLIKLLILSFLLIIILFLFKITI